MTGTLTGKRILIVEDEYFIAADLKRALAGAEAEVVGPVGNLTMGLPLAADEALDAAVLDVNLEGELSYPIAAELDRRSVPYIYLTGYDEWSLPEAQRETPRLAKPFTTQALVALVARLCRQEEVR